MKLLASGCWLCKQLVVNIIMMFFRKPSLWIFFESTIYYTMLFSQDPDCPKMWWLVSAVFIWDCSSPGINEPGFDTSSDLP